MEHVLQRYALIKSLYDKGGGYIDCFWPFSIQVITSDKFITIKHVQALLEEQFDMNMPLHVLGSVIKRARVLR